jgi:DNA-binding IclR family transcriptional regulator
VVPSNAGVRGALADDSQGRGQKFAVCFEEQKIGFNALAVPVTDPQGKVIAALTVLGPAYSLTRDKAMDSLERLKAVSTEITQKLE